MAETDISVDGAAAIILPAQVADIAGYEKSGPALEIEFTDGQTLRVDNFFAVGPDGEYSEVMTSDGRVAVSALVAPEPVAGDVAPVASSQGTAGLAGESSASAATEATADESPDWADPMMLTGVGLAAGLGSTGWLFSSDDSSGDVSAAASAEPAEASQDIEALLESDDQGTDLSQDIATIVGDDSVTGSDGDFGWDGATSDEVDGVVSYGTDPAGGIEVSDLSLGAELLADLVTEGEA
ncbi:hypothetical protein ATO6_24345 [Oceanicola sp. 22II-s10i]|uniref:hypothetical protein n=1 Tax=Oceanicola sp. 22II-s10i TaxID=1317116 RepID=UPI000B51F6EB|nr:hypothetical protein [Oceanicola sp. 22II-s10i]OWU80808.1 hypothetical protein ATO6_24345 [Oceanicola sp. 22II-s10i]